MVIEWYGTHGFRYDSTVSNSGKDADDVFLFIGGLQVDIGSEGISAAASHPAITQTKPPLTTSAARPPIHEPPPPPRFFDQLVISEYHQ
jgi:hypothetical protein